MSGAVIVSKGFLQKVFHRVLHKWRAWWFSPHTEVSRHNFQLRTLGTLYGGWTFIDVPSLHKAQVVSCGLGEDGSFDVEFARRYQAQVLVVDPTPRAIQHFNEIAERFGQEASTSYSRTGQQLASSYDLSGVSAANLRLYPRALWNESKKLRFYAPTNQAHVSHSITNFQNDYRTDTAYIEVDAVTIDELIQENQLKHIALMKLDIEGAEIEVVQDMMRKGIKPAQLLIEYDELNFPSPKSRDRIEQCHALLLTQGYRLVNIHKPSNFLYTTLT